MDSDSAPIRGAGTAGGRVLALATRGIASVRGAAKPLHPAGRVYAGRLTRGAGGSPEEITGVEWLDHPGEDEVVVRLSRAIGLPAALPDIHGLALRIATADGPADVLFASTGTNRLTRFVLTASRDPEARPMTTLLPYRTATGPVMLRAQHAGDDCYDLSWARPWGPWHSFAMLHLGELLGDPQLSFDPVLNQLPGLSQYPAVRSLREPSYLRARRSRTE